MNLRMIGGVLLGMCTYALVSVPASAQVCASGYARDERESRGDKLSESVRC